MSNIPLKEAIASGTWLDCHAKRYHDEVNFRLKVMAFDRTSVEELGGWPPGDREDPIEGILWLLSVEVVNLCKTPQRVWEIKRTIKVVDEDGYEFEPFCSNLDNNKNTGLYRFSGNYDAQPFLPKIKASGAIEFVLPDEEKT